MQTHYMNILESFGFCAKHDFYDASLALFHEIHNYINDEAIFVQEKTIIEQHADNPEALLTCQLTCLPDASLDYAVDYLKQLWTNNLRYQNVLYDEFKPEVQHKHAKISCITVALNTACTILINIDHK